MNLPTTKKNIEKVVFKYTKENPDEFKLFTEESMPLIKAAFANGLEKGTDMKPLYELPVTLFSMFIQELDEDEMIWFKTKKGAHWFIKEFKTFAL